MTSDGKMTHSERRDALKTSLRNQLDEVFPRDDSSARQKWLAKQIAEYLDRWLGFVELKSIPMRALVRGDLFLMIELGVESLLEETHTDAADASPLTEEADKLLKTLRRLRTSGDGALVTEIRERVARISGV